MHWLLRGILLFLVLLVAVCIACAEYLRHRGTVTIPLTYYYGKGHVLSAPMNALVHALSTNRQRSRILANEPDAFLSEFAQVSLLRNAYADIREEALAVVAARRTAAVAQERFFTAIAPPGNNWTKFALRWHGPITEEARRFCPRTCAVLDAIGPDVLPVAMFSVLQPGSHIKPHNGPYKGCWRYHLCLQTEQDAARAPYILVDGQKYMWRQGEDVLFDDTYWHEVHYPAPPPGTPAEALKPRIVLFADIQRIGAGPRRSRFLTGVTRRVGPLSSILNRRNETLQMDA
jgi:beta-hydroxylase